ncbi:N-acetylmuramic acid 6-phosphate etherase [Moritella sp. Urea-trap-13]|uniref:N-acetylmuramic acid 6-phosphate etherase n=1 Tax=Moritella sp. Urea-trap-13 TaxID=2058327 RepID=UPI000C32B707|nr:N-acetylmuramic acid 6-phosphate etherase [Moritella sp. Urea-trap-13]PKH06702.1 N-acetylmuramic acid 6-phosphate etherase [Moritella sp. Urea-trap-13]
MDIKSLTSEQRNSASANLDQLSTLELVKLFNSEDDKVTQAIKLELPLIAAAIDMIAHAFQQNGRLIYIGAGTSGRLGVLDASECPPTFGVGHQQVQGIIAGGEAAMFKAQEGAEDDINAAQVDLEKIQLTPQDVVVGIAASGRTPYVIGGLSFANKFGCDTIAISCNDNSPISTLAKIAITPVVGAEVLTGSSRMKAGTAQKLVLNMLSTGAMVRTGKVYQNLMVDVKTSNEKLITRSENIIMDVTGVDRERAQALLVQGKQHVKSAILMELNGVDYVTATQQLAENQGFLRQALTS